LNHTSINTANY